MSIYSVLSIDTQHMESRVRITAFVAEQLAMKFADLTWRLGVSATALFARTLPAELDYLAEIPANKHAGLTAALVRLLDADEPPPRRRLNITLKRKDAARMNRLCREKRVTRDDFISAYVSFLVNGEQGVCEAPLEQIAEILKSPRHFAVSPVVPQGNPYDYLHVDYGILEKLERTIREDRNYLPPLL